MADNTELNPGSGGDVSASNDIGGVKFQRVKPVVGDPGVAVDVSLTNPMPGDLRSVAGTAVATGSGVAAAAQRVELPTDGQGRVFSRANPVANSPGGRTTVPFTEESTEIVPANATRKSVLLYNEGANTVRIGVGEAATVDRIPLLSGAYLVFEGVGAINGWLAIAAGADVDVTWTDEGY